MVAWLYVRAAFPECPIALLDVRVAFPECPITQQHEVLFALRLRIRQVFLCRAASKRALEGR